MTPGKQLHNEESGQPTVMKRKPALYGLAQSPAAWFGEIDGSVLEIEFVAT